MFGRFTPIDKYGHYGRFLGVRINLVPSDQLQNYYMCEDHKIARDTVNFSRARFWDFVTYSEAENFYLKWMQSRSSWRTK